MKRILLILATAVVAACSDNMITAPQGRDFTIGVGEIVSIKDTPLALRFTRVTSDSRCPIGALCVQSIGQGNAQIEIEVALAGEHSTITLNTTDGPYEATVGAYTIRLQQLQPFRQLNHDIAEKEYRANLVVTG